MKKLFVLILFISPCALAQFNGPSEIWGTSHLQKADMLYQQHFFEEAIVYYKKELEQFDFKDEALFKIARCYRKLGDYKNERNYYLILAQTNALEDPKDIFNYAEALLSMEEYKESAQWFNNYLKQFPGDEIAIKKLEGIDKIDEFKKDSTYRLFKPFPYNSEHIEFGAVPFGDGIAFTSAREKDLIVQHDYLRKVGSLLDTYHVPFDFDPENDQIERLKISNHWRSNDGPMSVGKELVVVNRNNGKKKDDIYNSLGLQFYTVENQNLEYLEAFEYNNASYSIMHPTISENEDTLFSTRSV